MVEMGPVNIKLLLDGKTTHICCPHIKSESVIFIIIQDIKASTNYSFVTILIQYVEIKFALEENKKQDGGYKLVVTTTLMKSYTFLSESMSPGHTKGTLYIDLRLPSQQKIIQYVQHKAELRSLCFSLNLVVCLQMATTSERTKESTAISTYKIQTNRQIETNGGLCFRFFFFKE